MVRPPHPRAHATGTTGTPHMSMPRRAPRGGARHASRQRWVWCRWEVAPLQRDGAEAVLAHAPKVVQRVINRQVLKRECALIRTVVELVICSHKTRAAQVREGRLLRHPAGATAVAVAASPTAPHDAAPATRHAWRTRSTTVRIGAWCTHRGPPTWRLTAATPVAAAAGVSGHNRDCEGATGAPRTPAHRPSNVLVNNTTQMATGERCVLTTAPHTWLPSPRLVSKPAPQPTPFCGHCQI